MDWSGSAPSPLYKNAHKESRPYPGVLQNSRASKNDILTTMKIRFSLAVALLGFATTLAFGSPIALTFSGVATGTLGTTSFTDEPFSVTSGGDTSSVFVTPGPIDELPAIGATIDIAGFSAASFTDATSWTDPQGSGDIIFNDTTLNTELLGFTRLFAGLETYQFQTSIGPISGGFPFIPNIFENFQNIPTSEGLLTITMTSNNVFTAVVSTPELASGWLVLIGVGAVVVFGLMRHSFQTYQAAEKD
jgi:hypothetical protein